MKRGFAPDCDPDMIMPNTEIGLQAMLAARLSPSGFAEYRASRRIGYPATPSETGLRDIARLFHGGVFSDDFYRGNDYEDTYILQSYLNKEQFNAIINLDHPELFNRFSCATADNEREVMRERCELLSEKTGIDEYDMKNFHSKIGIHPIGAELIVHDDEKAEHIRKLVYDEFPCQIYSHGAVHGDFAVNLPL